MEDRLCLRYFFPGMVVIAFPCFLRLSRIANAATIVLMMAAIHGAFSRSVSFQVFFWISPASSRVLISRSSDSTRIRLASPLRMSALARFAWDWRKYPFAS